MKQKGEKERQVGRQERKEGGRLDDIVQPLDSGVLQVHPGIFQLHEPMYFPFTLSQFELDSPPHIIERVLWLLPYISIRLHYVLKSWTIASIFSEYLFSTHPKGQLKSDIFRGSTRVTYISMSLIIQCFGVTVQCTLSCLFLCLVFVGIIKLYSAQPNELSRIILK